MPHYTSLFRPFGVFTWYVAPSRCKSLRHVTIQLMGLANVSVDKRLLHITHQPVLGYRAANVIGGCRLPPTANGIPAGQQTRKRRATPRLRPANPQRSRTTRRDPSQTQNIFGPGECNCRINSNKVQLVRFRGSMQSGDRGADMVLQGHCGRDSGDRRGERKSEGTGGGRRNYRR